MVLSAHPHPCVDPRELDRIVATILPGEGRVFMELVNRSRGAYRLALSPAAIDCLGQKPECGGEAVELVIQRTRDNLLMGVSKVVDMQELQTQVAPWLLPEEKAMMRAGALHYGVHGETQVRRADVYRRGPGNPSVLSLPTLIFTPVLDDGAMGASYYVPTRRIPHHFCLPQILASLDSDDYTVAAEDDPFPQARAYVEDVSNLIA